MPETLRRRTIRYRGYDYSQPGAYFVTICVSEKKLLFGSVMKERVELSQLGKIAEESWKEIPEHFAHASLDEYVVMPNHFHGILILRMVRDAAGATHASPLHGTRARPVGPKRNSLAAIIGSFKSATSRKGRIADPEVPSPLWQRNYYERIIRDEQELMDTRNYIRVNPHHWHDDEYFS